MKKLSKLSMSKTLAASLLAIALLQGCATSKVAALKIAAPKELMVSPNCLGLTGKFTQLIEIVTATQFNPADSAETFMMAGTDMAAKCEADAVRLQGLQNLIKAQ
jgi:hypothetical protein